MKILIDTHILLWALSNPEKLPENWKLDLQTRANTIYVSSISIAEIMIKNSVGKLDVPEFFMDTIKETGFEMIKFSPEAASMLKDLPLIHKDPFDRMLITQALENDYSLMTVDEKIQKYDVKLC